MFLCVRERACMRVPGCVGVFMRVVRVALLTQHAMRMRHIVKSFVAPQAVPHFPHYFMNGTIFGKKRH